MHHAIICTYKAGLSSVLLHNYCTVGVVLLEGLGRHSHQRLHSHNMSTSNALLFDG